MQYINEEQKSPRKTLQVTHYDKNRWEQRKLENTCQQIENERRRAFKRLEGERVYWRSQSRLLRDCGIPAMDPDTPLENVPMKVLGLTPGSPCHTDGHPRLSKSSHPVSQQHSQHTSSMLMTGTKSEHCKDLHEAEGRRGGQKFVRGPRAQSSFESFRSRRKTNCEACISASSSDKVLSMAARRTSYGSPTQLNERLEFYEGVGSLNSSLIESLKGVEQMRRQKIQTAHMIGQMEREYEELAKRVDTFCKAMGRSKVSIKRWRTSSGKNMKVESDEERDDAERYEAHRDEAEKDRTEADERLLQHESDPHRSVAFCNLVSLKDAWQ